MSGRAGAFLQLLGIVILAGLSFAQQNATQPMITGTVAYRERMALPADAAIDVRLEDVSRQDAPAKVVAENVFAAAGQQVPIAFQLAYNPADINPAHTYSIRASINVNGQMMFTSTTAAPVLTGGAPSQVSLMLQQVKATPAAAQSGMALEGTHWVLTELAGNPVAPQKGGHPGYIELHKREGRLAASSGCNALTGTYIVDQSSLRLEPAGTTMMMCTPDMMQQEQVFTAALKSVAAYRIEGSSLTLLDGQQHVIAKFQGHKKQKQF